MGAPRNVATGTEERRVCSASEQAVAQLREAYRAVDGYRNPLTPWEVRRTLLRVRGLLRAFDTANTADLPRIEQIRHAINSARGMLWKHQRGTTTGGAYTAIEYLERRDARDQPESVSLIVPLTDQDIWTICFVQDCLHAADDRLHAAERMLRRAQERRQPRAGEREAADDAAQATARLARWASQHSLGR